MVRSGTFNLNNLFSRFNFQGEIATAPESAPATGTGGTTLTLDDEDQWQADTLWFIQIHVVGKISVPWD